MKRIELSDITQDDFDAAAAVVASGIKAFNRRLDVRAGTVLRDLLVNPEAAIESVSEGQIEEARKSSSLKRLQEAQESGEQIDQDDVDAILSNFNLKASSGTKSRGIVKVVVSDGTVAYSVSEGSEFSTVDGISFSADEQVVAAPDGMQISRTTKLYNGAAGFFFLVPVTAVSAGSSGNILHGTSLDSVSHVTSFVMAEAYKDFDGGSDVQPLGAVIKSIPSGLSIRGFVNKTAVEGMLRDKFDGGNYPIVAVSSVGYGNSSQRRDRHNVFGVSVGGRIDVYVRNFYDIATYTGIVEGTEGDSEGEYTIDVPPGMFPGACWIKSVSDPFSGQNEESVLSSLAFEANRTADVSGTWHDIDVSKGPEEAFNTVWQGFRIRLYDVPQDGSSGGSDSSGNGGTRQFKVTAYCLPQINEIQEYVDREDVRSVSTDVVVRCPIICKVSVNAVLQYDPRNPIEESDAKTRIREYINGLGFVGRVTRSDIVYVLKKLGAVSVDMPDKDMLYGELHDAKGKRHVLSGDAIDVGAIDDGPAMLSRDTVVFATDDDSIQVKMTPIS